MARQIALPLEKLPPGRYDVQVAVMDPDSKLVNFWQAPIAIVQ